MKTLTYGTVPSFEEFKAALTAEGERYYMALNGRDAAMLFALGLRSPAQQSTAGWNVDGKLELLYTAKQLFHTLDCLCAVAEGHVSHGEPWTDEQMEWAGNFASSILSTLGFEWV